MVKLHHNAWCVLKIWAAMLWDQGFCSVIFKQNTLAIEVNLGLYFKARKTFKKMNINIASNECFCQSSSAKLVEVSFELARMISKRRNPTTVHVESIQPCVGEAKSKKLAKFFLLILALKYASINSPKILRVKYSKIHEGLLQCSILNCVDLKRTSKDVYDKYFSTSSCLVHRGVTRLDGARSKKQVWRPIMIQPPGNCAPLAPFRYAPACAPGEVLRVDVTWERKFI